MAASKGGSWNLQGGVVQLRYTLGADKLPFQLDKVFPPPAEDTVGGIFPDDYLAAVQKDFYVAFVQFQKAAHLRREDDPPQIIHLPHDPRGVHSVHLLSSLLHEPPLSSSLYKNIDKKTTAFTKKLGNI
jgi:hypothetical protein